MADGTVAGSKARAFARFLREERKALVFFLCSRTRTEEDAQDAAQESFVRLLRYRDTESPESWKALLYRIAINVANDQVRWAKRRRVHEHVSLDRVVSLLPAADTAMDERVIQLEELARIGAVIDTLPARTREIYLLSRVEGMKNGEIARHCAISIKTVEKHMTRALARVRKAVGNGDQEALYKHEEGIDNFW